MWSLWLFLLCKVRVLLPTNLVHDIIVRVCQSTDGIGGHPLSVYLNIIQIIISVALIALTVIQGKGAGLGRMMGGDSSLHRTRRGVEKTMYNATIILAVVFFLTALINVLV